MRVSLSDDLRRNSCSLYLSRKIGTNRLPGSIGTKLLELQITGSSYTTADVPEPTTISPLAVGLAGLGESSPKS